MIGHTKAAAGLASLIKVAKALHHKVLPPTIGVKTPNPACHFETGPFYINSETRPWLLPGSNGSSPLEPRQKSRCKCIWFWWHQFPCRTGRISPHQRILD